ncbi:unnamed protein product [Rotaria socialis]|uniref:U-box domain-containing protein n=1 Tax=Rotaria socialis TaxID=392032 RepID=A0A820MBQ1_9BILA|nr:unnamed protein product [Rotaria socialis]CAF3413735.1 unnamed protein product [Rotaria socialis]CAF3426131.1 unnamed protein product [Rotaria socialis]CAF3611981.1 unnamed protein product [Rotaria socialis]CAF4298489.1 unnamed protein product [Rotaria socialis]
MNTPKDYLCPITLEIMDLPVILIEDGRSYEKRELQRWLQNHNTSPTTNKVLKNKDFIINISLKNAIEEFREKQIKAQHCETLSHTLEIKPGGLPQEFQNTIYSPLRIKICLLGDSYVGKTSIVKHLQFQNRVSKTEYVTTCGPDVVPLHLNRLFDDHYAVSIHVYDLPGELKWKDVWKSQYKCHGAIFVCNVTDHKTLISIENEWYPALKTYGFDLFEGVLLCNKIDVGEDFEDQIFKDAHRFSTNNDLSLFHTSAITGKNIQAMFNHLVLSILSNRLLLNQLKQNTGSTSNTKNRHNERSTIVNTENIVLTEKRKRDQGKGNKSECCCSKN